ncbi:BglG family transcription antiterminator [Breznakia pachnodae]|uniref:Lichenan operon transcriptional antiterminator n=1 Tax=Breznakia pachnodae TaxID=265178 RepID=A0ABU0E630_9FIRM|nr:BglG family transcription antiterminator [Breznakia pachnodae]MDQ0362369.1 lichenan operon transcriptional antiterminator [Breznakia pachnodae]
MRKEEILKRLLQGKTVWTSKQLATLLNVSDRTIRDDIKKLNYELENQGAIIVSSSEGYSLDIQDNERFQNYLQSLSVNELKDSLDQIVYQIIYMLLIYQEYIKLDDLCEELYISRSTANRYMKEVKTILKNYDLKLVSKPNYGMRIEGRLVNIRRLLADKIADGTFPDLSISADAKFKKINRFNQQIMDVISEVLNEQEYQFSDITLESLLLHIQVMYMIREFPRDHTYVRLPQDSQELEVARILVDRLSTVGLEKLEEDDIHHLAIQLKAKHKYDNIMNEENPIVSEDLNRIVNRILEACKQKYNVDFFEDFDLWMSLSLHLIPLVTRIRYQMRMRNPLLDQTKATYPLAFNLAVEVGIVLKEEFDVKLDEDELGYFAIYFSLALDRHKVVTKKRKILIVCSSGRATSSLLAYKIKSNFNKYIDFVETTNLYDLHNKDVDSYDYILTTVPVNKQLGKPIIQISCFLDSHDVKTIESSLTQDDKSVHFTDCIEEDQVFCLPPHEDYEVIIREICNRLPKRLGVGERFVSEVLQRDKLYSTAIGNLVAIPHSIEPLANQTFVSITILEQPILWKEKMVQVVVLLGLQKDLDQDMQVFYKEFTDFVTNESKISKVIHRPTYKNVIDVIKEKI